MTATADMGGWWRPTLGLLGDERLARHAGAGDARAFEVVYLRYHQALYRYCRSILRNDADAQDALQSTFAAAFAALQSGQRDAPMRPWLFRIAHNESISVLRRRRPCFELSVAYEQGTTSIEDQVDGRAEMSSLLRDLRELNDRQRSALVLRELCGLSHQEIAIALGTSIGAAKQTIFEARRSLFEFAEGRAMACDEIRRTISDADGRTLRGRRVRAHLRSCGSCAAFAATIPARSADLRALAPPLPAAAAAGFLGRLAGFGAGRGASAGVVRLAAGAAGKTAFAGAGFGANALAGVAVVASATVSVTLGVDKIVGATGRADASRGGVPAAVVRPTNRPARAPSPSSYAALASAAQATWAAYSGARLDRGATPNVTKISSVTVRAPLGRSGHRASSHAPAAAVPAWSTGAGGSPAAESNGSGTAGQFAPGAPAGEPTGGSAGQFGADPVRTYNGTRASTGSTTGSSESTGSGHHGASGSGQHGQSGSGHDWSSNSGSSAVSERPAWAGSSSPAARGRPGTPNLPSVSTTPGGVASNAATATAGAVVSTAAKAKGAANSVAQSSVSLPLPSVLNPPSSP